MPEFDEKRRKIFILKSNRKTTLFFLKGSNNFDWVIKNRLSHIFNPNTGKTVMIAIDHDYFQGPTTGLERVDVTILPLLPYSDTLVAFCVQ